MIVFHAPPLFDAWRSLFAGGFEAGRLGGCIGLSLAMVFFILKVRNVAYLRFHTNWRSAVVLCMVVALLHLDSIRPGDDPTMVPECTTLAATTWLVSSLPPVRRRVNEALTAAVGVATCLHSVNRSTDTIWLDAFRPHCWTLAFASVRLRGPPA
jgi:hypothetical protein